MQILEKDYEVTLKKIDALLNDDAMKKMGRNFEDTENLTISLFEEEKFIGGIAAKRTAESLHVTGLAIGESYQSKGYGSQLMKRLEERAKELGVKKISVSTQNFQALNFYQNLGYEIFGQLDDYPFTGTTKNYLIKRVQGE